MLFVGPHQPYLAYVADVLPSLGEEGVQTCTLRDLVAEGAAAADRGRPRRGPAEVRRAHMVAAIEAAVRLYEEPPDHGHDGRDPLGRHLARAPTDWAEAFDAPEPGTPHNEARDQVWEELLAILVDKHDDERRSPARRTLDG